jgi:hypothetical protein
MTPDMANKIYRRLWSPLAPGSRVYAIVDGARNEKVYPAVKDCVLNYKCLYIGNLPAELQQVAPYLVQLEKEDYFTANLVLNGWEDHWGIYFSASAQIENLHHHLRRFLTVVDETGKQLVFRYYDPRVLRVFLPTCNSSELNEMFGPVEEFIVPGQESSTLLRFRLEDGGLVQEKETL